MKPRLYMIIPCYNEEKVLPITSEMFLEELNLLIAKDKISESSRILFVNDGSKDKTWDLIKELSEKDEHFIGICQSRNRGHQNAVLAGMMEAKDVADITISIDCDGQDDIAAMEAMVDRYHEGCEIVYGVRSNRDTDTFFKRFTAQTFYKLLNKLGGEIVYNHADYRLVSARVLKEFANFKEVNLFLRGMIPLVGFKSTSVYYERHERLAGESHYPLSKMLALALAFVYFVMVAQFQSLLSPFIVLFTIPLAFTGGMLGLMAAGEQLSLISLMGFLVLMGVVVNNGIVFVDYANQLRIGGLERTDALVATGRTRMRPILMTTLTTVLAMVTMLFGTDMASEMSTGMAIVIIGGLSYATLMTLFVVPVLYDLFYRRPPVNIDVGDDGLDDLPDDAAEFAAEFAARRAAEAASAPRRPDLSRAARAPEENDGEKKETDHDNG